MKKNIVLVHGVDVPQQGAIDLFYYTKYLFLNDKINIKSIVSNIYLGENDSFMKKAFIEIGNNYSKGLFSSIKFIYFAFMEIKKINKKEKIDYIHFFSMHPMSVLLQFIVKYFLRINTIYDIISGPIGKGPIYYISYITEKIGVFLSKKYIVDHVKLVDLLGFDKDKEHIEIGIGCEFFNKNFNKNLIKKEINDVIFMYVGSLNKDRELEKLIKVFNNLGKNFKLYIIGKGNDEENLKKKVKNNNIYFLGYMPHKIVYDYMNCSDVLISYIPKKKYFEYQPPTKLLEGLSLGKPVICTNTYAQIEILNGFNNLIFEDNYEALYNKIVWISKNLNNFNSEDLLKISKKYCWKNLINNKLIPFYFK